MTLEEAKQECEYWLAHIERQKGWARRMQEAAALAKTGEEGYRRAQTLKWQIDREKLEVYDGARLEPAIRLILKHLNKN